MQGRFSRVFGIEKNLYLTGSPVLIAAGALLQNNENGNKIAQLKIQNISAHTIKEVHVAFRLYAANGDVLEQKETFAYLQLDIERDAFFGEQTPIYFSVPGVSSFSVWVESVVFKENGTRPDWKASEAEWSALQPQKMLEETDFSSAARLQYKREFKNGSFIMQSERDLWQCACGSINRQEESSCHKCQVKREDLQSVDSNALEENADIFAQEESIRAIEEQKQKKKTMLFTWIGIALIVVIFLVVQCIRMKPYWDAKAMLNSGEAAIAYYEFFELGNFKDSKKLAEEALLQHFIDRAVLEEKNDVEMYAYWRDQTAESDANVLDGAMNPDEIDRIFADKSWYEIKLYDLFRTSARKMDFSLEPKNVTIVEIDDFVHMDEESKGKEENYEWGIGRTLPKKEEDYLYVFYDEKRLYRLCHLEEDLIILKAGDSGNPVILISDSGKWFKRWQKFADLYIRNIKSTELYLR